jgi:hypothetical protein
MGSRSWANVVEVSAAARASRYLSLAFLETSARRGRSAIPWRICLQVVEFDGVVVHAVLRILEQDVRSPFALQKRPVVRGAKPAQDTGKRWIDLAGDAVETDLQVEREPGLKAGVHEPEEGVLPVMVEVKALSGDEAEFEAVLALHMDDPETLAGFDGLQHADQSAVDPVFSFDLTGQGFLVHVPAGKVEDGAPEFFVCSEGGFAELHRDRIAEGAEVLPQNPGDGEELGHAGGVGELPQGAPEQHAVELHERRLVYGWPEGILKARPAKAPHEPRGFRLVDRRRGLNRAHAGGVTRRSPRWRNPGEGGARPLPAAVEEPRSAPSP